MTWKQAFISNQEGVRGGSVTLSQFILRHRPIFDVSNFPMLWVFGFPQIARLTALVLAFTILCGISDLLFD